MPECVMEQACAVEEDEEEASAAAPQPIYLEPFRHQVGGHSSMLRFDDTTVCKPLVPREQYFYETIPEEMKEFAPQFRGVTKVQFSRDREGYMTLVAYPCSTNRVTNRPGGGGNYLDVEEGISGGGSGEEDYDDTTSSNSDSESSSTHSSSKYEKPRQRFRIRRSGSIEMETSKKPKNKVHNPWYLRCYKVQLEKMKKSGMDTGTNHKFILLENLASDYKFPCILDLKMGTRQHGDDASEEKRLLHTHKCSVSTSSSLGTRLCGMQSYQATTGQYICRDKYYGRTLSEESMRAVLYQFVHNGVVLRRDVVERLLERLHGLYRVLTTLPTYRFYSSSLLLMYDAGDWDESAAQEEPAQASQCAQCLAHTNNDKAQTRQQQREAEEEDEDSNTYSSMQCDDDSRESRGSDAQEEISEDVTSPPPHCPHHQEKPVVSPKVDVRMIDFAHVTHEGFRGDKIIHEGPDHGYLFGLENLIQIFENILHNGDRGLQLIPLAKETNNGQVASTSIHPSSN